MRFLSLVLLVSCSFVAMAAPPANADCGGPHISVNDRDVRRGEAVRIVGEGWGDDCLDTGIPPDAHGILGNPLDDIVIAFVQNGMETVVARGSADDGYRFEALVTVPSHLLPGAARLVARSGEHSGYQRPTMIVSTTKPIAAEGPDVRNFGQQATPASRDTEPVEADDSHTRAWLLGGAAVLALAAGAALILGRARRSRG